MSSTAIRTMRRRQVERVFAGVEHAAEIIERGVDVGAAYRLVQCANEIVVAVLLLVVDRRASLHHLLQAGGVEVSPARAARQTSPSA